MIFDFSFDALKVTRLDYEGRLVKVPTTNSKTTHLESVWGVHNGLQRVDAIVAVNEILSRRRNYLFVSNKTDSEIASKIFRHLQDMYQKPEAIMAFLTSGSTGAPKVVVHTVDTLIASASKIVEAYPNLANRNFHHVFPTTYVAGILNCIIVPIVAQGSIFLDEEFNFTSSFKFAKNNEISESDITWLSPGMIASIAALPNRFKLSKNSLKLVLSATGHLTTELRQRGEEIFGCKVFNTYGTSEQLLISGERFSDGVVTLGEPFIGVDISYSPISETNETSQMYETLVKTDTKALCILNLNLESMTMIPDKSPDTDIIHTRDLVYFSKSLPISAGRIDDIVVLGGVNISLSQIETKANTFPGLLDSCARAELGGTSTSIQLLYELGPGSTNFAEQSFRTHLQNELSPESMPRRLQEVKFIRSPNGKIQKSKIRTSQEGFVPK